MMGIFEPQPISFVKIARLCGPLVFGGIAITSAAAQPAPSASLSAPSGATAPTPPSGGTPAKPAARPDFKNLRFDESWTTALRSSHWDDAIKAIPLAGSRPLSLTLGGQLRWREESYRGFNTTALEDDHAQSRLLLNADMRLGTTAGWYGRGFAEWRDAQSYGRNLPGGARPNDADRHDLQNGFLDVGYRRSFVRVGRQEIALGRERLIGVPDWSNTRRGSQGVRAQLTVRALQFELVNARPMLVRQARANRPDSATTLRTVSVGSAPGAAAAAGWLPATWQGYWYEQRTRTSVTNLRRLTTGARLQWQWRARTKTPVSLEFEGASQRGHSGANAVHGWFWVAEGQQQWKRLRGAPTLALGVEEASGERAATTTQIEAFAVLFPAAHAHGGYADVFGRTNVRERHAISTWSPWRPLELRVAAYRFSRLRLDDGVWTKQNTVLRSAGRSTARHVADEVDVTGTWKMSRHWKSTFGVGTVDPGAFLRSTPGSAHHQRWGFLGTAFTF